MATASIPQLGANISGSYGGQYALQNSDLRPFVAEALNIHLDTFLKSNGNYFGPQQVDLNRGLNSLMSLFADINKLGEKVITGSSNIPFWMERALPTQAPTGNINDEQLDIVVQHAEILVDHDDLGLAPVVAFDTASETLTMSQKALALEVNLKTLMTPQGVKEFGHLVNTLIDAIQYTKIFMGFSILNKVTILSHQHPVANVRDYDNLFHREIEGWAPVSLKKNGLYVFLNSVFKERGAIVGSKLPTMIVLGPGTAELSTFADNNEVMRQGQKSVDVIEGSRPFIQNYKGAKIYEQRPLAVNTPDGALQEPMSANVQIGYHFVVPASHCVSTENYNAECANALVAHNQMSDKLEKVGFEELMNSNPYYTLDGSLDVAALTEVLTRHDEMLHAIGVSSMGTYNGSPKIDPHIATIGDSSKTPYIISTIGESMGCYFSDTKLSTIVATGVRKIEKSGGINLALIQSLKQKMMGAYESSADDVATNVAALYPNGYNPDNVRLSAHISLPDGGAYGVSGDVSPGVLATLEPLDQPLPAGCSNLSWALLLSRAADTFWTGPRGGAAARRALLNEVNEAKRLAGLLCRLFDDSSAIGRRNRNPLFTKSALPINQIPGRASSLKKNEIELIAAAQNLFFFVGQPVISSASTTASQARYGANFGEVANYNNGTYGDTADWNLLSLKLLESNLVSADIRAFIATSSAERIQNELVIPFNTRYDRTSLRAGDLAASTQTENFFAAFVDSYVLPPAGSRDATSGEWETTVKIFAALVSEVLGGGGRFFGPPDWERVQLSAQALSYAQTSVGYEGEGNYAIAAGATNGVLITSLVVSPDVVASAGNNIRVLDARSVSSSVSGADARVLAKGVESQGFGTSTPGSIFHSPFLSSSVVGAASSHVENTQQSGSFHGAGGFRDSRGEFNMGEDAMREAEQFLFSNSTLHKAIMNPDYARRVAKASLKMGILERAVELAVLNIPFRKQVFINMKNENVEPPITMLVFYPSVTFKMLSAYALNEGVGKMRQEFPNITPTRHANQLLYLMFNVHLGGGLLERENVTIVPNVAFSKALGGMCPSSLVKHSGVINSSSHYASDTGPSEGDGFVISAGVSYDCTSGMIDITGGFNPDSHAIFPDPERLNRLVTKASYPSALFHNLFIGGTFGRSSNYAGQDFSFHRYRAYAETHQNTMTFSAKQWVFTDNNTPVQVAPGYGFGAPIYPGQMRTVYAGNSTIGAALKVDVTVA